MWATFPGSPLDTTACWRREAERSCPGPARRVEGAGGGAAWRGPSSAGWKATPLPPSGLGRAGLGRARAKGPFSSLPVKQGRTDSQGITAQ